MNATDRTLEEVLIDLVEKGEVVRLIVIGGLALIIGALAAWFFTRLYFQKFKYVKMENDVAEAQKKQEEAEEKATQLQTKYNELERKYKALEVLQEKRHATLAKEPDVPDPAVRKIFKE